MQNWLTLAWTDLLARGVIGVGFGVLAMAWPGETIALLVLLWGCWALLDGLIVLVSLRAVSGSGPRLVGLVTGIVSIAVAVFAIVRPGVAASTATWFIGAWLLVRGVMTVLATVDTDTTTRGVLILSGLIDGLIGVLFLANPGSAVLKLAFLVGLLALTWGLVALGLAYAVRRQALSSGSPQPTESAVG